MPIFDNGSGLPLISWISLLIIMGCSTVSAFSSEIAKPKICKYHYYQLLTEIDGHSVTTEFYVPDGSERRPLVFMLHGSAGAFSLYSDEEPQQDNFGEKTLARNCFVVALPHYFEAVGLKSMTSEQQITSMFPALLAANNILLSKAESTPSANKTVLIFGESLGGFLSIALALQRHEVDAVSEYSGGVPLGYLIKPRGLLKVLISHGESDAIVPVSEATALYCYLREHGIQARVNIYPGEGHYLSITTRRCILDRTITFFRSGNRSRAEGH